MASYSQVNPWPSILDTPEVTSTASLIGIAFAISGNVLISLALNCQKLAHRRLEGRKLAPREDDIGGHTNGEAGSLERQDSSGASRSRPGVNGERDSEAFRYSYSGSIGSVDEDSQEDEAAQDNGYHNHRGSATANDADVIDSGYTTHATASETTPLLLFPSVEHAGQSTPTHSHVETSSSSTLPVNRARSRSYGQHSLLHKSFSHRSHSQRRQSTSGTLRRNSDVGSEQYTSFGLDVERVVTPSFKIKTKARGKFPRRWFGTSAASETGESQANAVIVPVPISADHNHRKSDAATDGQTCTGGSGDGDEGQEGDYLKSKLWWFGFLLMNVGEVGNFISYGFAPASVVAPLGTFALIANCFFAPLILKEKFRRRDILGIFLAILGAVTVVLSSNSSEQRLDPKHLIAAITQKAFIILAIIYVVGIVILVGLSTGRWGRQWVFVDVGACAFFGGFTVLSTKAFSTLLTMEWWDIFREWITYPVVAVLIGTGVGQIKYLNRALMKFDSKVVIPTQFVLFNLSAIVGSAVLYGDFRKATFHQMVTFLYGCGATFAGVFMLTSGSGGSGRSSGRDGGAVVRTEVIPVRAEDPPSPPVNIVKRRASTVNIIGLSSPAKVLLACTPPSP